MTFKSKRTITSILAGLTLAAIYIAWATGQTAPASDSLKSWALAMLIFIGLGIVALIIIQILFHIAYSIGIAAMEHKGDEKEVERIIASATAEDEMDRLINLKSARVGYAIVGLGFGAALAALAFGASALPALHIVLGSFAMAALIEGCISVIYYEMGLGNG